MGGRKNMILNIFALVLIVGTTAITWSNKLPPIPAEFANRTGCYIREMNDVIPFDESVHTLGYCYLIHCTSKKIKYISCGATDLHHDKMDCYIAQAKTGMPYPECCPIVKCIEKDVLWGSSNETSKTESKDERRRVSNRYLKKRLRRLVLG